MSALSAQLGSIILPDDIRPTAPDDESEEESEEEIEPPKEKVGTKRRSNRSMATEVVCVAGPG